MLVLILLMSNTMDAQTIYDKNGAMFSFTKDSYKPNISYYNSIGIEFCEHENF